MSGRAGRRGIDDRGVVVLLLDDMIDTEECEAMMRGEALPLTSAFVLRYNTLLRLYALETFDPQSLIRFYF